MSSKTYVVWSCAHATPENSNDRFDWLGNFLYDLRPDVAIDLGDSGDFKSLNSYDTRYPQAIVTQSYEKDVEVYNDSMERIRRKFKENKRKRPYFVGFSGNHEKRIETALAHDPRLEGDKYGVSFKHLQTDKWFDEYHPYMNGGPAIGTYGGIDFAHFFSSGNFGTATSGKHHAYTLLSNRHRSSVCGHSHKRGVYFEDQAGIGGLVVGCMKGGPESWAGQSNRDWWTGAVVLNEVDGCGRFEPQFISLKRLREEYS